ncbi:hypothetical protein C2I36_00585 [Rhodobacteraceae bacterium WD3A24]|nr:hypothetical protein C2I36_00585 [Rhodobacteraceae bacterium WD3A24]
MAGGPARRFTEVVGTVQLRERHRRKGRLREVEVRAFSVTLSPDSRRIEAVRVFYTAWREALVYLAGVQREGGDAARARDRGRAAAGEPYFLFARISRRRIAFTQLNYVVGALC